MQVRVCDTPVENSELLETCLSEISDNKDLSPSPEKIRDSDHSAATTSSLWRSEFGTTESSTVRSTALRKTVSDRNLDNEEMEDGKVLLHPDSTRDLLKNALNLPEVIGRREKLV